MLIKISLQYVVNLARKIAARGENYMERARNSGNEIDGMRIASSLAPETDEPDGDSGPADGEESGDGFICARFRSLEFQSCLSSACLPPSFLLQIVQKLR